MTLLFLHLVNFKITHMNNEFVDNSVDPIRQMFKIDVLSEASVEITERTVNVFR